MFISRGTATTCTAGVYGQRIEGLPGSNRDGNAARYVNLLKNPESFTGTFIESISGMRVDRHYISAKVSTTPLYLRVLRPVRQESVESDPGRELLRGPVVSFD